MSAEDDGGADEDEDGDVDEDGGVVEAAVDGGEEDSTSSSDSDDVDGDPDYDPELDESEKGKSLLSLCINLLDLYPYFLKILCVFSEPWQLGCSS